jgi:hypothetical protein
MERKPMAFNMYHASVPVFIRGLRNLSGFLAKGHADAEARKIDFAVLIQSRMAPDMFPLARQVQIATDMVKNGAARLAGTEIPSYPDTETTHEELQARLQKTIEFLEGFKEAQFEGSESREVVLKFPHGEMSFSGADYLTGFVLPNLYFHSTAAFVILRHNGVQIGKRDFMGA